MLPGGEKVPGSIGSSTTYFPTELQESLLITIPALAPVNSPRQKQQPDRHDRREHAQMDADPGYAGSPGYRGQELRLPVPAVQRNAAFQREYEQDDRSA